MIHLSEILNNLLNSNTLKDCRLDVLSSLQKLVDVLHCKTEDCIFKIRIDNNNTDEDVNNFLKCVQNKIGNQGQQSFLSYFVDEFICNVQQHANVQIAYGFAYFEQKSNHLFLGIADGGITIYGSYVASQKYLEKIGNNEEQSLYLAQKGYSTKNLPGAEIEVTAFLRMQKSLLMVCLVRLQWFQEMLYPFWILTKMYFTNCLMTLNGQELLFLRKYLLLIKQLTFINTLVEP